MPTAEGASVAVIVVSYGSAALLGRNLAYTVAESDALVIVVENHEDLLARASTRALCEEQGWLLVQPRQNLGFGGGNNEGVACALSRGSNTLVLLNPDLSLEPGALAGLVARAAAERDVMVAPAIVRPDGSAFSSGRMLLRLDDGTMLGERRRNELPSHIPTMPWLSGACLALSAGLWQRTGGFASEYFLYWEDVDLSRRVLQVGGRLTALSEIRAVHDEGATHRSAAVGRAKSTTYYYFNIRNRMLFARRWLSPRARRRWWWRTPVAVRAVLLQGGRRQLLGSLEPWRAALRGVWDGARRDST